MSNFSPPAGSNYVVPATVFERTVQFNAGYVSGAVNITTPAVPSTGVAATNTTTMDARVYLSGGTVSAVLVNGGTIFASAAAGQALTVLVPANQTIAVNYTSAPTWVWQAA
jgi:hypothetical protein